MHISTKHFALLLIVFILSLAGFAQEKINTDSLSTILYDTTKDTLVRVEAGHELAHFNPGIQDVNDDQVRWATDALELAKAINAESYYTRFYFILTSDYVEKNNLPKAIEYMNKAFKYGPKAKIKRDFVYTVLFRTFALIQESNATKTDSLITDMQQTLEKINLSPEDSRLSDGTLLTFYYRQRRFPESIFWANKVLNNPLPVKGNEIEIFYSYQFSSEIYSELKQLDKAKQYAKKALHFANTSGYPTLVHNSHNSMAKILIQSKEYEMALVHIDSALGISPDCDCKYIKEKDLTEKGNILNKMGRFNEALEVLEPLKEIDFGGVFLNNNYLAETYYNLGDYENALKQADYAMKPFTFIDEKRDAYSIKYKSWQALGDYKKAFENFELFHNLNDSIINMQSEQRVVQIDMENQYEKEKLEAELNFQTQITQQKATKNLLMVLGGGAILFALALFIRLRHSRKTKEIIEAEKQKAQASERAKHQFLANMSHEIRTPMNAIKGMTDILIRRQPKADQKEYLEGIKQSSDSLLVIINDILDISKIEANKIELEHETFSVTNLLKNVHSVMKFKAEEKGLELKKSISSENLTVKGDATRLRQILFNLIGNAIKFTEKGVVTTKITSEKEGNTVHLHFTVSDTGIGIEEDRIEKIFRSFEQAYSDTSRKFGGTGLGLSISKKLIELHKGKIWVESEKGKGSQFHFMIPYEIAEDQIEQVQEQTSSSDTTAQLKDIRVLLVEDNQFNAVVAKEELEDAIENVRVDLAENGAIAVEKVKSNEYDIILMDVQMPKMNGYEATKTIRSFDNDKSKTPIIAMTANVLKEEVDKCYNVGMNDFIGKPFDTAELLQKIHNLKTKNHE